jgi:predicted lipase
MNEMKLAMRAAWAAGFDHDLPIVLPNEEPPVRMVRGSLEGYIFHNPTHVIVAFQGTEWWEPGDVKADLNYDKVRLSGIPGKWHEGFVRGAGRFWVHLLIWLRHHLGDRKLILTGFSLGSALAQAMSIYVSQAGYDHVVYSFGGPRVANRKAAQWLADRVEHHRVFTYDDWVKHLPPFFFGFKHIGKPLKLGSRRDGSLGHNRDTYLLLVRDLSD